MKIRRPAGPRTISLPGVRVPGPTRLPGDFLDELAAELDASLQEARRQAERLAVISELQRVRRPVTLLDIIESAGDESERERLTGLVKRLRA